MDINRIEISVVMAVYNGEKFLRHSIESILSQTFPNFEFIIIDDGSRDDSVNIIKSYNDDRIKLIINSENYGQSKSLNRGISASNGKYIARIDQDDYSAKDRLKRQKSFLDLNQNIALVGCWSNVIDNNNHKIAPLRREPTVYEACAFNFYMDLTIPFRHSSVMIRRETLTKVGLYNDQLRYAQDTDLWYRMLNKGYHFSNIPAPLCSFRKSYINQTSYVFRDSQKKERNEIYRLFLNNEFENKADPFLGKTTKFFEIEGQILNTLENKEPILKYFFKKYNISLFESLKYIVKVCMFTDGNSLSSKFMNIVSIINNYYGLKALIAIPASIFLLINYLYFSLIIKIKYIFYSWNNLR